MVDEAKQPEEKITPMFVLDKKISVALLLAMAVYAFTVIWAWANMNFQVQAQASQLGEARATIVEVQRQVTNMGTVEFRLNQMDVKIGRIEDKIDQLGTR